MHLSVKVPIEYPSKAIHIKVNSTIQAAKVEYFNKLFYSTSSRASFSLSKWLINQSKCS